MTAFFLPNRRRDDSKNWIKQGLKDNDLSIGNSSSQQRAVCATRIGEPAGRIGRRPIARVLYHSEPYAQRK